VADPELLGDVAHRSGDLTDEDAEMRRATNQVIVDTSAQLDRWSYNNAVATWMEFVNRLYRYLQTDGGIHTEVLDQAIDTLLKLLAPATPHIAAELHAIRHEGEDIHREAWPVADESLLVVESATMVVQVNGKVRDRIEVPIDVDDDTALELALASEKVRAHVPGEPTKVISRPPKIVNIVV
jgi:leucyl-tRNA synthetase